MAALSVQRPIVHEVEASALYALSWERLCVPQHANTRQFNETRIQRPATMRLVVPRIAKRSDPRSNTGNASRMRFCRANASCSENNERANATRARG